MSIEIETQRLILREYLAEDKKALISIANQPHIGRWLPDWIGSEKWAAPWIKKVQRHYITDNPQKEFIELAVELRDKKELIGSVGIGGSDKGMGICYFMSGRTQER